MDRATLDEYIRRFNEHDASQATMRPSPSACGRTSRRCATTRFAQIQVAYNSFTNTKVGGEQVELGIPP